MKNLKFLFDKHQIKRIVKLKRETRLTLWKIKEVRVAQRKRNNFIVKFNISKNLVLWLNDNKIFLIFIKFIPLSVKARERLNDLLSEFKDTDLQFVDLSNTTSYYDLLQSCPWCVGETRDLIMGSNAVLVTKNLNLYLIVLKLCLNIEEPQFLPASMLPIEMFNITIVKENSCFLDIKLSSSSSSELRAIYRSSVSKEAILLELSHTLGMQLSQLNYTLGTQLSQLNHDLGFAVSCSATNDVTRDILNNLN